MNDEDEDTLVPNRQHRFNILYFSFQIIALLKLGKMLKFYRKYLFLAEKHGFSLIDQIWSRLSRPRKDINIRQ